MNKNSTLNKEELQLYQSLSLNRNSIELQEKSFEEDSEAFKNKVEEFLNAKKI